MRPADQDTDPPKNISSDKFPFAPLVPLTDPTAMELEESNRRYLEEVPPTERENMLLRALTVQQMSKYFGIAYAHVFGSQIRALKILNVRSVSRAEAEGLFNDLKAENESFRNWSFDQYIHFLLVWKFVEEKDGWLFITETGRSFLQFMVGYGLTEDRQN